MCANCRFLQVVEKNSAILRTTTEREFGIRANHIDMVKFANAENKDYERVARELSELVASALNPEVHSSP
jgi:hypothetical protein